MIEDLSLTDLLLLIGLVGIGLKTIAEVMGWTPTNKLLREENIALADRHKTLESEKAELVLKVAESKASESKLFARIESLELIPIRATFLAAYSRASALIRSWTAMTYGQ